MRQAPTYTSWKISCQTAEDAQALQRWLGGRLDLASVFKDNMHVTLNGVDKVQTVRHRLGDYFSEIRVLPDTQSNPATFRLVFHRRPDGGRFWKDLMVNILQEVETAGQKTSIELDSKGEADPTPSANGSAEKAL